MPLPTRSYDRKIKPLTTTLRPEEVRSLIVAAAHRSLDVGGHGASVVVTLHPDGSASVAVTPK